MKLHCVDYLLGFFPPSFLSAVLSSCCLNIFQDWAAEDQCPAFPCPWCLLLPSSTQPQKCIVRQLLAGLQVTVSNPINLPAWLQIILRNQGTQCCPRLPSLTLLAAAPACKHWWSGQRSSTVWLRCISSSSELPAELRNWPILIFFPSFFYCLRCFGRPGSSGKYYDHVCLPAALSCALCCLFEVDFVWFWKLMAYASQVVERRNYWRPSVSSSLTFS